MFLVKKIMIFFSLLCMNVFLQNIMIASDTHDALVEIASLDSNVENDLDGETLFEHNQFYQTSDSVTNHPGTIKNKLKLLEIENRAKKRQQEDEKIKKCFEEQNRKRIAAGLRPLSFLEMVVKIPMLEMQSSPVVSAQRETSQQDQVHLARSKSLMRQFMDGLFCCDSSKEDVADKKH